MKKFLKTLAAVMGCALLTMVTSCSKDDENNQTTSGDDGKSKPTSAVMNCTLLVSPETITAFDFQVKYYDADGQEQQEAALWTDVQKDGKALKQWKKSVTAKLPAKLGFYLIIKAKAGIDLEVKNNFSYDCNAVFTSYTAGNGIIDSKPYPKVLAGHVDKNTQNVQEYIDGHKILDCIVNFDENGKSTTGHWQ